MGLMSIDLHPSPRTLRQFGAIGLVAFAGLAALVQAGAGVLGRLPAGAAGPTTWVLAALAAWCGLMAAAAPAWLRPLYLGLTVVTYPIGLVVSWLMVVVIFYGVLTPIGLVFKLIGRDAMHRQFDPAAPSYWIRRHPPADVKRYFRQF
jgi:hypothetical protein